MVKSLGLRTYLIALVIFLLGGVAGAGISHALSERSQRDLVAGGFDGFERRKVRALKRKLDLSDEQVESVRRILREDREKRRKLTEEVFERCGVPLERHRGEVDERIRAVLDPEQQKRFERLPRRQRHPGPPRNP